MDFILLEYKDQGMSGEAGRVAVWVFSTEAEAMAKFHELEKNGLPHALYFGTLYFRVHKEEEA